MDVAQNRPIRFSLLICATLLTACANQPSVTENQCKAGDWESLGYRDGAAGYASTQILRHQDACGQHNIVPDKVAYLDGWRAGLEHYCTPTNGFELGARGQRLNTLCDHAGFKAAFNDGRQLYQARAEVNRARQAVTHAEKRLGSLKQEIVGVSTAQLTPDLTLEERTKLVAKLNALIEERDQLNQRLPHLKSELFKRQEQLEYTEQQVNKVAIRS